MPYDAERVGQLRKMLVEARKRKLSAGLKARREQGQRLDGALSAVAEAVKRGD
jgi:hypothetical protein